MEWSAPDGALYAASFDDPLSAALANQRLRTALSLEGEWLRGVLSDVCIGCEKFGAGSPTPAGW